METSRRNARIVAILDLMYLVVEIIISLVPHAIILLAFSVPILFDEDYECETTRTTCRQPWPYGYPVQGTLFGLGAECMYAVVLGGVYVYIIFLFYSAHACIVSGLITATDKASRTSNVERARKLQRWIYFSYIKLALGVFAVVFGPCKAIMLIPPLVFLYFVRRYNEDFRAAMELEVEGLNGVD